MLEMHACKNMHVVLAHQRAISNFIQEHHRTNGGPTVSEDEFVDLMRLYDE